MIPHRHPFLMIDKVVDVVANERATGIKNVSINENYFQGHFPARPVMPGVLIIEAMAQTAAVLVVHTLGPESEGKLVYFMSVDNARFRRPVVPGDRLDVHVIKQRNRGNVWKFEGRAKVGGQSDGRSRVRRDDPRRIATGDAADPPDGHRRAGRELGRAMSSIGPLLHRSASTSCWAPGSASRAHVVVDGRTTIGERTRIFPFASIGLEPQDLKYEGEASSLDDRPSTTRSANM